jgi:hypothetical protein
VRGWPALAAAATSIGAAAALAVLPWGTGVLLAIVVGLLAGSLVRHRTEVSS